MAFKRMRKKRHADIPLPYYKALERVWGHSPRTYEMGAHWLVSFTYRDVAKISRKEWRAVQWEALLFAYRGSMAWEQGETVHPLPVAREILEIKNWLHELWANLTNGEHVDVQTKAWMAFLKIENGVLHGTIDTLQFPWPDAFKYQVYETLTDSSVQPRLRFCHNDKCRRPFIAHKRQIYCSTVCSQSHRTRLWRKTNRERFRAKRREAYKRKMQAKLNTPVKIQKYLR